MDQIAFADISSSPIVIEKHNQTGMIVLPHRWLDRGYAAGVNRFDPSYSCINSACARDGSFARDPLSQLFKRSR